LRTLVISGNAFDRQVATRGLRLNSGDFRTMDGLQKGDTTRIVIVDTDTQIDFSRSRVGVELFVQAQDRVTGGEFDCFEKCAHFSSVIEVWTPAEGRRIMTGLPQEAV